MAKEIEAKFFIDNKDFLRSNLKKLGLKLIYEEHLMKRKCFHPDSKNKGEYIRVRDEGDKITMTYKYITGKTINDVEEVEISVDNFENACEFIEKTNYHQVAYQETLREVWGNDEVEIVIDTWPFLQSYIEIEAKSESIVKKYSKNLNFNFDKEAYFGAAAVLYNAQYSIPEEIVNRIPLFVFGDQKLEERLNSYLQKTLL